MGKSANDDDVCYYNGERLSSEDVRQRFLVGNRPLRLSVLMFVRSAATLATVCLMTMFNTASGRD